MINLRVLLLSILGILFIVLAFVVSPWFMAGAVIVMLINQRELMKKPSKKT
jgi:preprotein translocase subunit SecF